MGISDDDIKRIVDAFLEAFERKYGDTTPQHDSRAIVKAVMEEIDFRRQTDRLADSIVRKQAELQRKAAIAASQYKADTSKHPTASGDNSPAEGRSFS